MTPSFLIRGTESCMQQDKISRLISDDSNGADVSIFQGHFFVKILVSFQVYTWCVCHSREILKKDIKKTNIYKCSKI